MNNSFYRAALLVAGSLTLCQPAVADATIIYEQSSASQKLTTTMQIKSGKIRFTPPDQSNNYSIYDSINNQLSHVDTAKKQYLTMDEKMIEQQAKQAKQQMDKMRQAMLDRMKDMPAEQRKQVEQMMNNHLSQVDKTQQPPKLDQKKTSRTETVSGIQCSVYEAYLKGIKHSELCMTEPDKMSINKEDAQTLVKMQKFMKHMQQIAQSMMGTSTATAELKGIPLHTTLYKEDGSIALNTRLLSISIETISSNVVTIPADYTIMQIPGK